MHKGDPVAAAGRRWISADRRKRNSTKSGAPQAQARAKLSRIGATVGFGAKPTSNGERTQARLEITPIAPVPRKRSCD
jgi:hypothetical protein